MSGHLRSEWKRHYSYYVECDFCGQQTKGRIYATAPTKVRCGACDRIIASVVTLPPSPWEKSAPQTGDKDE